MFWILSTGTPEFSDLRSYCFHHLLSPLLTLSLSLSLFISFSFFLHCPPFPSPFLSIPLYLSPASSPQISLFLLHPTPFLCLFFSSFFIPSLFSLPHSSVLLSSLSHYSYSFLSFLSLSFCQALILPFSSIHSHTLPIYSSVFCLSFTHSLSLSLSVFLSPPVPLSHASFSFLSVSLPFLLSFGLCAILSL